MKQKYFIRSVFFLLISSICFAQTPNTLGSAPFTKRYDVTQKGNKVVISNSVTGRASDPNGNYNGGGSNNNTRVTYADIDSDPSTFSSSSATYQGFGDASCTVVTKAYLYWAGTYPLPGNPSENSYPLVDPRGDFRNIKFQVPGGSYVDINPTSGTTATQTVYNGYRNTPTNPLNVPTKDIAYVCVSDVTDLLLPLATLDGDYTVANVRTYEGNYVNGVQPAAGWILVFITENALATTKYMSVYDGYSGVGGGVITDYAINGFSTIPAGPVNAQFAIGALEGDRGIGGDNLNIRTDLNATFTRLAGGVNPGNNFFNSTISLNGNHNVNRNPASTNTLGFDSDVFRINNPLNIVIPNNETGATFRVQTSGDGFGTFMNAFEIEVIEPELFVTKRVFDTSNTDITGGGVTLGQELFYQLEVQNIGNDNAVNTYILDDLPLNVDYLPGFETAPAGVTTTYDAGLRQLRFDIDPSLVQVNDASFTIRFKVQVIADCAELRDACSNIIENIATNFYQGEINSTLITASPSFFDIDACNFGIAGSSNFLINTDDCDFIRNEVLCGNFLDITAGSGYTNYEWTDSSGNVIGNTQTIRVTSPGTYQVDKTAPSPCVSDIETVIVDFFNNLTNPLLSLADNVQTCTIDGSPLPEFFLCGINDVRQVITGVQDAQTISWQQLDTTSCPPQTNLTCFNDNSSCVWNQVATGSNFNITTAGSFRVRFDFPNGCFRTFYFNAYQNTLSPTVDVIEPIVCNNPGIIQVQNVPSSGYEFSLSPTGPFQSSPTFGGLTTPNSYTVYIRQNNGLPTACLYDASTVLPEFDFNFDVIKNDIECRGDKGSITMQVTNGLPNYDFIITNTSLGLNLVHNSNQSTHTFNNLDPGTYVVDIAGFNGLCLYSETVIIEELPELNLSLVLENDITCGDGLIRLVATGGTPNYNYAISSINGTVVTPSNYVFQSIDEFVFAAGEEGTYEFIVVDQNNCSITAGPIDINLIPSPSFAPLSVDTSCSNNSDGQIDFNVTSTVTGSLTYSIDGGITFQNTSLFNNLSVGTYDLILRNTINGVSCDQTDQVTINNQPAINADIRLLTDLNCNAPAQLEVFNVSGGSGGYTYSIDGSTYLSTSIFDIASSGSYTIFILDSNGCTFQTNPIDVTPVTPITDIVVNATAQSCPALTSDLTVSITGGTAPFNYEIIFPTTINNGNSNVFLNITPDTYILRVRDSRNCLYEERYTLTALPNLSIGNQVVSDVTCVGDTDGEVSISIGNVTSTYSYNLTGPVNDTGNAQTSSTRTFNNLLAGSYSFSIIDEITNCQAVTTFDIDEPAASLQIDNLNVTDLFCSTSAVTDGNVVVFASGGWGGNSYILTQPDTSVVGPQTSSIFNGLSQTGLYTVEVTDINGCIVNQSFNLTPAVAPVLDLSLNTLCYNLGTPTTLTATVSSGGTAPFQYQLNSGAFQNSNTFDNLVPGTYTVNVVDSKGCTETGSITVSPELTGAATLIKELDCSITPEAQIMVSVNGGSPNYSYELSINGGAYISYTSGFPFSTNTAADYSFRITDASGCSVETAVIIIAPITSPDIVSVNQTQFLLCNGDGDAAIEIQLDGALGTFPVSIEVNGVSYGNQTVISGLNAGLYNITVTDDNGCQDTSSITISEPDPISFDVDIVDITCDTSGGGSNLGEISVQNVVGGTAEYTYYLTSNFGFYEDYTTTSGGEDHTFVIVNFGVYTLVVEDSNGCTLTENNIIMASPPDDLIIDVSSSTPDCTTGASVTVTASSPLGSGNYLFAVLEFNTSPYSTNFVTPNNGPDSHIFSGLIPGAIYTFVVQDLTTNCFFLEISEFPTAVFSNLTNTINPNDVTCEGSNDGSVSFTFDNYDATTTSVDYQIYDAGTVLPVGGVGFSNVNPPTGSISVDNFGTLAPGNYFIVFTENGGINDQCTSSSTVFTIEESVRELEITATSPTNDNCNVNAGLVTSQARFGSGGYQYVILPDTDPAPLATSTLWSSVSSFNVESGSYIVYVRDSRNCIRSTAVIVALDPIIDIAATVIDECVAQNNYEVELNFVNSIDVGIPGYTLSVDSGPFSSISGLPIIISSLSSGSHTFTVRDSNGCIATQTLVIYDPLELSASVIDQPSCSASDGVIEVTALGGSLSYNLLLLDSALVPTGNVFNPTSSQFTGIISGNYFVELTDVITSCVITIPIELETPEDPILLASTVNNVSCAGSSDGQIILNLDPTTNSNPNYSYTLIDEITSTIIQGPQSSPIFSNLSSGTYRGQVTSGRDCSTDALITITEPSMLSASSTLLEIACDSNNTTTTAQITVVVDNDTSGNPSGTAPYLYSIDGINYQASNVFDIIDTGIQQTITVETVDANNCSTSQIVVVDTLQSLTGITFNLQTSLTCTNPEQVEVIVAGGSGTYDFNLLPNGPSFSNVSSNSRTFNLTVAGDYSFEIVDVLTGCEIISSPYTVLPVLDPTITATAIRDVNCINSSTGSLEFDVTDYSGNYNFDVLDQNGLVVRSGTGNTSVTQVVNNLAAGIYTIEIIQMDAPFCNNTSNAVQISQPVIGLTLDLDITNALSCNPGNDAVITAVASGGWADYTYSNDGVNFGTASTFSGLGVGTYTIYVRDRNVDFCEISTSITIDPPVAINATIAATNLVCAGDSNGEISVLATGGQGVGTYFYSLIDQNGNVSTVQTNSTFFNLPAGTYSVLVNDNLDCSFTTPPVVIADPLDVTVTASLTQALTCTNDAVITVTGFNGTAPYEYSADGLNFTTNNIFTGLSPDTYSFFVRDVNGCLSNISNGITVEPIIPLTATQDLTNAIVNCDGDNDATITVQATGGLGNYNYELFDSSNTLITGPQTSGFFDSIGAGSYYVTVTSGDCVEQLVPFVIDAPNAINTTIDVQDISCFGEMDGRISITASGGAGGFIYSLDQLSFGTANVYENLAAGSYDVFVQDANGCFEQFNVVIIEPTRVTATPTIISEEVCIGDGFNDVRIDITGGSPPYTITYDNVVIDNVTGNDFTYSGLDTGVYSFTVRDANNCVTATSVVEFTQPIEIVGDFTVSYDCENGNELEIINTNPSLQGDLVFTLDNQSPQSSPIFQNVSPGFHQVEIMELNNGCTLLIDNILIEQFSVLSNLRATEIGLNSFEVTWSGGEPNFSVFVNGSLLNGNTFIINESDSYDITVRDSRGCEISINIPLKFIDIEIPNVLTPNGDGDNDTWQPDNIEVYPNSVISIFDRYGRELKRDLGINIKWEGIYQGQELPSGDYWYAIELKDTENRVFKGNFTLYR